MFMFQYSPGNTVNNAASFYSLDNLLLLVYPVFGGWAINAVMEGNVWQAMLYGVVVLLM